MNCADFERWLDSGQIEAGRASAEAHARECRPCASALAAATELEALLAGHSVEAPPSFTEAIMLRVAAEPQRRADPASTLAEPTLPWWIQCLAQPETVLAAILGAITLGLAPRLIPLVESLFAQGSALTSTASLPAWSRALQLTLPFGATTSFPGGMLAAGILVGSGVALGGWALYRWGSSLVNPPFLARAGGRGLSGSSRTH